MLMKKANLKGLILVTIDIFQIKALTFNQTSMPWLINGVFAILNIKNLIVAVLLAELAKMRP